MAEKILIVDDDVQTLRLVGMMLERQGFQILAANTGEQALQTAKAEQPDVVILDIMMPDMDGFEVTRLLRSNAATVDIPILMFTAKSQVEDKVTGYEAGADDYLTKPIHPAELTAHLRALLARSKSRGAPARERGLVLGVLAAKGGLGVSTVALNLALAIYNKIKTEVIAAEMRPGQGTWSTELAHSMSDGLSNLLSLRPSQITPTAVENELARMPFGLRLLMASPRAHDTQLMRAGEQMTALLEQLPLLAHVVVLDLGTNFLSGYDALVEACSEIMVVTEPNPVTAQRTRYLLDDLTGRGFGRTRLMTVVSVNRIRSDTQMTNSQLKEILGQPVAQVIPPAPEMAFQVSSRNLPMTMVPAAGIIAQQYSALAEHFSARVPVK